MPVIFYDELTKHLKKGKFYEIIEATITKYMTQNLLKAAEFIEISENKNILFQLTDS